MTAASMEEVSPSDLGVAPIGNTWLYVVENIDVNYHSHVTLSDEDEYEDYDEKIQSISCVCRG